MLMFKLNDTQTEQWHEFQKKHQQCCVKKTGRKLASPSGGGYSVIFTPTGIGDVVHFKCHFCGEEENVTDYGSW